MSSNMTQNFDQGELMEIAGLVEYSYSSADVLAWLKANWATWMETVSNAAIAHEINWREWVKRNCSHA